MWSPPIELTRQRVYQSLYVSLAPALGLVWIRVGSAQGQEWLGCTAGVDPGRPEVVHLRWTAACRRELGPAVDPGTVGAVCPVE